MLTNGQLLSSFVFTLCVVGVVLVALVGIVFVAIGVWRLSQPLREWLSRSWVTRLIRATETFLEAAIAHAKSFVAGLLVALFARPWQTFISLLAKLGNVLRQVPWGICVCFLVACSLPFLVFAIAGIPLQSIIGIAAAGALIGVLCALFTGWHYRALGPGRVIGASLFTIVVGAWGSSLLIATLIAMTSD